MAESDAGQAGDEKKEGATIEVTPEMERVGAQILENMYDALPSEAEQVASRIFVAMMRETLVCAETSSLRAPPARQSTC